MTRSCPFCGSKDNLLASIPLPASGTWVYYVTCDDCGASGPKEKVQEEAENRWDKRVIVP